MATWNGTGAGTFEGEPRGTTDAGTTDETFKALKQETRLRGAVEHDWSDATVSGAPAGTNDNGRHREGSARAFYQASDPTALTVVDTAAVPTAALGATDDGRLLVRSDQAERLKVWDGSAWQNVGIGSLDNVGNVDLTTDAPDDGDVLQYDGTNFIPAAHQMALGTATSTVLPISGSPWTTITALTAAVTIPATANYAVKVTVTVAFSSASGSSVELRLNEDTGGGPSVVEMTGDSPRDPVAGQTGSAVMLHIVNPATASTTYTYTVEGRSVSNSDATVSSGSLTSRILVERIPVLA